MRSTATAFAALTLGTAAVLGAAVDIDLDLAALRASPDAAVLRAALPPHAAAAIAAHGPADRLHLRLDDAGDRSFVLAGIDAVALAALVERRAPRATTAVLAPDTLAVGLAGSAAPTAIPAAGATAIAVHVVPAPEPRLPIMRRLSSIDLGGDGAGRFQAVLTAHTVDDAAAVEARLLTLRDHPPLLLPPAMRTAIATLGVQRYDCVIHVSGELPAQVRATVLRVACERLRARMGQQAD